MRKLIYLSALMCLFANCSKKNQIQPITYKSYSFRIMDSVVYYYDVWKHKLSITDNIHFTFPRTIIIFKSSDSKHLVYLTDTFQITEKSLTTYSNKSGYFPLIYWSPTNDSLTINFLLGQGTTWRLNASIYGLR
jgi:hypothetical protein